MPDSWPKAMPIVEVEWIDSSSYSGWQEVKDAAKSDISQCRSSGYLFRRDKKQVSIVQNMSDVGHVDMVMSIPRSCVLSIKVLQKAQKKGK